MKVRFSATRNYRKGGTGRTAGTLLQIFCKKSLLQEFFILKTTAIPNPAMMPKIGRGDAAGLVGAGVEVGVAVGTFVKTFVGISVGTGVTVGLLSGTDPVSVAPSEKVMANGE